MSQAINDAAFEQWGLQGYTAGDEIWIGAGAPTSQQAALPIKGQMHRIIACGTNGASLVLKSILSSDNPGVVIIFNDTLNGVAVFPFKAFGTGAIDTTESMNGTQNASFTVSPISYAIFVASPVAVKRKGGATPLVNWSAVLVST